MKTDKPQVDHHPGDEQTQSPSLSHQALRGGGWRIAGGVWQAALRLGASIVLARVLAPEAFGVLGMVILICGLAGQFIVGGITSGMIAKTKLTQPQMHTAFALVATLQAILFVTIFTLAPFAESFFQTPQLTNALRIGAITLLTAALGMAPTAILSRAMRFGALTAISAVGVVVEMTLAILLTLQFNLGAIGLIYAFVIADAIMTLLKLATARWRPGLSLHPQALRYFAKFGAHQITAHGGAYLIVNADQFLIGAILGPNALGIYLFALRLPNLVYTRLAMPAASVVLPSLGQMQGDAPRIFLGYAKSARYLALLTFPLLAGLAVLAQPLVQILWGPNWIAAVIPMRILCVAAAIRTIACSCGSVFLSLNRTDLLMKNTLIKLPIFYAFVTFGAYFFGLNGAACAVAVGCSLIVIDQRAAARLTGVPLKQLAINLWPPATAATACAIAAMFINQTLATQIGIAPALTLAVLGGAAVYLLTLRLAFPHILNELRALITSPKQTQQTAGSLNVQNQADMEVAA